MGAWCSHLSYCRESGYWRVPSRRSQGWCEPACWRCSRRLHGEQRRHQVNSVPEILYPEVLIEAVLVVVVIGDGNYDGARAERALNHIQRDTRSHIRHFHGGTARTLNRSSHLLRNWQIHGGSH